MQTIDQPITATGAAAELTADADPYFVVGMLATLTVRLVNASGTPAPPAGLGNVAAWRFVLAEDWDAATVPCYRTESVAYDPGTATWTVPLTATRTEQALKALGKKGEIAIGCELVGLPENGTWDKPAFVLQWNAKLRGRRDSDGSPTPVDPAPVTAHAATHASTGSDPVTPSSIGAAAATHSHTLSDISDAGDAAGKDVGTTAGTVAAGDHTHSGYAAASALRYDLVEPEPTTSGTTVAVTLQDRAVNAVTLGSTVTEATFTFPAAVTGKARDFFVNLTIAGSSAPTIYFADPLLANANDSAPTLEFGDISDVDAGKNLILFSEVAAPTKTAGVATATHWLVSVRHEEASA